nr:transposase [Pelotalea chapellei]
MKDGAFCFSRNCYRINRLLHLPGQVWYQGLLHGNHRILLYFRSNKVFAKVAVKVKAPQATIVFDKFHIVKKLTEAVDHRSAGGGTAQQV